MAAEIRSPVPAAALAERTPLGTVDLEGLGPVRVEARTRGTSLDLWALDGAGRPIGEGHTVPGLGESLLYVRTPDGLKPLRIRWPAHQVGR